MPLNHPWISSAMLLSKQFSYTHKQSEYIEKNSKVASIVLWSLIKMVPNLQSCSLHIREVTFQIWIKSLQPFTRYEQQIFFSLVFFSFLSILHTWQKLLELASLHDLWFNWALEQVLVVLRPIFIPILMRIWLTITKLQGVLRVKQNGIFVINRQLLKQDKYQHVATLNIGGVPFGS